MSDKEVFLVTLTLLCLVAILLFAMRTLTTIKKARLQADSDQAYRVIAERSAEAQAEAASALTSIAASLADLSGRVIAIEKVLKEVQ